MKLVIKFSDQNYETTVDCNSAEINRDPLHKNTLLVKIQKHDKVIIRCYPLNNIEYYEI